jgi:hypothetical protein
VIIGDWHQLPQAPQRRKVTLPCAKPFVTVAAAFSSGSPQMQVGRGSNSKCVSRS